MKLLTLVTFSIISLNSFASSIDSSIYNYSTKHGVINTVGLTKSEVSAIESATEKQFNDLADCMMDQEETIVNETSCINDVLGDVHN